MNLKKTTREELKRLGLGEMGIQDEGTAQFFIRHYQAKENAARWKKEAEEANRQAAANWPAELHPGIHGVETASGCEFDIIRTEGTTVTIKVTNRKNGTEQEEDRADFLDRIKHGYVIVEDYTPEEKARREAYQKEHQWERLDKIFLPMLINPDVEEEPQN